MQCFGWRMLGQETTKMDVSFFPETFGTYLLLLVICQLAVILIFPTYFSP